mgnify:CR=1 FL=1
MATIKDKLKAFTPEQEYRIRSAVSVKENGKRYSIRLNEPSNSAVFQIDGDIIKIGQRCDKLILFETTKTSKWNEVFVELKGKDITHAIDQIEASVNNEQFRHASIDKRYARIVGKNIPRNTSSSVLTRAKIRFLKEYKCDLRAVNPGTSDNLQV